MTEVLTKAAARNIFYGGTVFFFAVFGALVANSFWLLSRCLLKSAIKRAAAPCDTGVRHGPNSV